MASVKVAIRVRPFNKREFSLQSQLAVKVQGNQVTLLPPASLFPTPASPGLLTTSTPDRKDRSDGLSVGGDRCKAHKFTFDYAYWSHDRKDTHFISQADVFRDLGSGVVDNAFCGYNICVFAYGQTGSGKTFTMMGDPQENEDGEDDPKDESMDTSDRGLIPRICSAMFRRMREGGEEGTYRTEVSYLEIYNERVRDLLHGRGEHKLRVREHPKEGPYVQNLSRHLVVDYRDMLALMEQGNKQRTTASTRMNDTSSRSHAIFTVTFVNAGVNADDGLPHETASKIHLVDLAGSERADASGATGERLKEGGHINKSLVTLGSVISALAEASAKVAQRKDVFIPYRDSVLTWLLKDSLGGNSKTIMIATVSPADVNHGETLSTLRYANRAKNIINKPTVNVDPNVKLIRDLREEIERLRSMMNLDDPVSLRQLEVKEAQERHLTEEWTVKWKEAANILKEQSALALKRTAGWGVVLDSDKPHLIGIDEDLLSTGIILYHLKIGETTIGSNSAEENNDIVLRGTDVLDRHCVIHLDSRTGVATLVPSVGALCIVNAVTIHNPSRLSQGCVVVLGKTHMFRYNDPKEAASMRSSSGGLNMNNQNQSLLSQSLSDLRNPQTLSIANPATATSCNVGSSDDSMALIREEQIKEESASPNVPPSGISSSAGSSSSSSSSNPELMSSSTSSSASGADAVHPDDMSQLYAKIADQKNVVVKCLESEQCDVSALNEQLSLLQALQTAYTKLEYELARSLWLRTKRGDKWSGDAHPVLDGEDAYEHHFSRLVEQEVDKRLFQEKVMRAEADFQEREALRMEKERELNSVRRLHEREIYLLKRKLHEANNSNNNILVRNVDINNVPSVRIHHMVTTYITNFHKIGSGPSLYIAYEVHINTWDDNVICAWQITRRFRQFRELHVSMCQKYGSHVSSLSFPSRRIFGNRSDHTSNERRRSLNTYLNALLLICSQLPHCPLFNNPTRDALYELSPFFFEDPEAILSSSRGQRLAESPHIAHNLHEEEEEEEKELIDSSGDTALT